MRGGVKTKPEMGKRRVPTWPRECLRSSTSGGGKHAAFNSSSPELVVDKERLYRGGAKLEKTDTKVVFCKKDAGIQSQRFMVPAKVWGAPYRKNLSGRHSSGP